MVNLEIWKMILITGGCLYNTEMKTILRTGTRSGVLNRFMFPVLLGWKVFGWFFLQNILERGE